MLELLSVLAKEPLRDSRRVALREREGVRERPPTEGLRSLPTSRYSELARFQPLQKGQKSHLISQPEIPSLVGQLDRLVDGLQDLTRWYQRCRQGSMETLSSAIHMAAVDYASKGVCSGDEGTASGNSCCLEAGFCRNDERSECRVE